MGLTPLTVTGVSSFSDDFQAIMNRAVSIASLPVRQLQNEQANLLAKKQTLSALSSAVSSLSTAVDSLKNLGSTKALAVTTSNANRVSVSNSGATVATSYQITEITSVAKAASETSVAGFANATSAAVDAGDDLLELYFDGQAYEIDLSTYGNNLNGLAEAINALGIGVEASVLNTGTGDTPYYLSVTASSPGAKSLELRTEAGNEGTNLLTASNQGANAVFKLNGLAVTRSDNIVTDAIPGVTFTIVSKTEVGETVTISLASSRGELGGALQNLVTAYNAVLSQVNAQIGESAGLLSGDFVVRHLKEKMRQLVSLETGGSGAVTNLTDLGIELDREGKMSFNSLKFYSLPTASFNEAFTFLSSSQLSDVAGALSNVTDPVSGLIRTQQSQLDAADRRLSAQVEEITRRIEFMQSSLAQRLQQADSLLARLESQQTMLTTTLESVNRLLFGKKDDS